MRPPVSRSPALCAPLLVALVLVAGCGDRAQTRAARPATAPPGRTPAPARRASRPRPVKPVPRAPVRAEPVQEGPSKPRRIALTFDADMTEAMLGELSSGRVTRWYARDLIKTLRATRSKATLFLTGLWAQTYPRAVRSFARDPLFEIAGHTWDHLAWTPSCYGLASVDTEAGKLSELRRTARILERLSGRAPRYFRFPGLCHAQGDLDLVAGEGEQVVDGVASGDAFQSDPGVIERTVLDQARPGAIVVMHMMGGPNAPATAEAVRRLIPELRDRGYRFATLTELLEG